ncbi:hypothetical protein [Streptomyces sp. NRRL F-4489]|nr:hypothetical protein [Streptomyces sp. NRRL F-4489]
MRLFAFFGMEVPRPPKKWARCELAHRHKGSHYAGTEVGRYWWE